MSTHYLAPLFEPASVAIVGASERPGAIGAVLIENMLAARFSGTIYPVNPRRQQIAGMKCYAKIADLPQAPDLAVIATPPATLPDVINECGMAGVRFAVVITAG